MRGDLADTDAERERYQLRFACDDCAHFDPPREGCSLGYPVDEHREGKSVAEALTSCKEFELTS
ncbi:MAG: hypothetical protein KC416_15960 [Myxococcales bacterium]|nr:hypothetical protein [Myxococcales bacterium]